MDSPVLDNRTDFAVLPHVLAGVEGEFLVVIVKATFLCVHSELHLVLAPKDQRVGVRAADVPWGNPEKSSIRYPSDLCLSKPGSDLIVVANACAPGGNAVPTFDAGIRVGALEKTIRIFGLRVWEDKGAGLSAPRPTTGVEVRYDYAWGGADFSDPTKPLEEPRNPVGMGVCRDLHFLTHKPAPMIEDPKNPIRNVRTAPAPAGLGVVGRHWVPRRAYWGTFDAEWLRRRAPLLPLDHDPRANLCASPGLISNPPLTGGEDCALLNLTPGGGTIKFRLPKINVTVTKTQKDVREVNTPPLDTVIVDTVDILPPATVRVEMVWRSTFSGSRKMKDSRIVVTEEDVSE